MLYRKFATEIEDFLRNEPCKILLVNGARQIGKSYIIRHVCKNLFKNYVEINLKEDSEGNHVFSDVKTTQDFYVQLGVAAGKKLGGKEDTIVFLDEIQAYPHMMTMLKFLNQENRYRYICSGSQLGIALKQTPSTPMGSVAIKQMYPLDFEEFLLAMDVSQSSIDSMREQFDNKQPLGESLHNYIMKLFQYYLLVGGLPDPVNHFVKTQNIKNVRNAQRYIFELYKVDASQYDEERKLMIRKIYDLIPSNLENKKKRVVFNEIENKKGKYHSNYSEEFDYLTASGVAIDVKAISNPHFPLRESEKKNLLKLYLNDVGLLTMLLYNLNINAILNDEKSINLGTVYESVVAQELHAHGFPMFYYDNKKLGEVDFLIDDYNSLSVLPIEVKSGKDYYVHSALNAFIGNQEYNITNGIVFNSKREVTTKNGVTYMPVYYSMFLSDDVKEEDLVLKLPEFPVD